MNVLVVCSCAEEYNTSSMLCLELVCKGLLENGHNVFYLSPLPDKNNRYYDENHIFNHQNLTHIRFGKTTEKTKIKVQPKKTLKGKVKEQLLRIYRKFDLFGKSIETLKYVEEIKGKIKEADCKPDILLSASDPKTSHILAKKIIRVFDKKPYFVQYWGDPLTLDISKNTLTPKFIRKSIERSILKAADKIVYVSPMTLEEQKLFLKDMAHKMEYQPTPCENKLYESGNSDCIGYFGSYNPSVRDIRPLYDAANKNKNFKLYIIGDSSMKLESTEYVEVIDRVPAEKLEAYYNKCGIIVDLTNSFGAQIPAKIFRDAGTNKEVLLIYDKQNGQVIKNYFSAFDRFSLCENDVDSIYKTLENYRNNGIKENQPLDEFNYVNVSQRIIQRISD